MPARGPISRTFMTDTPSRACAACSPVCAQPSDCHRYEANNSGPAASRNARASPCDIPVRPATHSTSSIECSRRRRSSRSIESPRTRTGPRSTPRTGSHPLQSNSVCPAATRKPVRQRTRNIGRSERVFPPLCRPLLVARCSTLELAALTSAAGRTPHTSPGRPWHSKSP